MKHPRPRQFGQGVFGFCGPGPGWGSITACPGEEKCSHLPESNALSIIRIIIPEPTSTSIMLGRRVSAVERLSVFACVGVLGFMVYPTDRRDYRWQNLKE